MPQRGREYAGALSLLALGAVLGPSGLGVLTPQFLTLVDSAIPVGLAALGVLAVLDLGAPTRSAAQGTAAALQDLAAAVAVAGSVTVLGLVLGVDQRTSWVVTSTAGLCFLATRSTYEVVPMVLGGLALAWMQGSPLVALWTVANTVGVAIGCAVAGWLMLRRRSSDSEQRAVAVALLLMIGGTADYLSVSALLGGLAAGVCWRVLGGNARESVQRDVTYLRQPVLAIVLLTAGAHVELTLVAISLGIGYAVAAWLTSRLGQRLLSDVPSGSNFLAVALALGALRVAGPPMALPLAMVVIGTMLLHIVAPSRGRVEMVE